MKVTIIAGARPNFMKIAPLMRAIKAAKAAGKNITARLVYTGSDEDKSLEPSLFTDLDMPRPDVYLHVDNTDFFQRMAGILVAFARELEQHPAQVVLVVDDLTPTMACSIVAKKKGGSSSLTAYRSLPPFVTLASSSRSSLPITSNES